MQTMSKWNPITIKTPDGIAPDFEFDLKGEVCPYTFVKSKLALEMLESWLYLVESMGCKENPFDPKLAPKLRLIDA